MRELYPTLAEDARSGIIRTAWHPVNVQQSADDSRGNQAAVNPGVPRSGFANTTVYREQYFIRFTVNVVGGKPWRVRVHGEVSLLKAGEMPAPLRGPEIPQWLDGRVASLEVAVYNRLKDRAVELKYAPEAAPQAAPKPLNVARFGKLPAGAARAVAEVERAAGARDVATLRRFMADEFTYSTGDEASAETAIVVWQADPSILAELAKAVDAGCGHDTGKGLVVCPASLLADEGAPGYRAGFRDVGGTWKMVFFIAGD